jgi:hypothetical protein
MKRKAAKEAEAKTEAVEAKTGPDCSVPYHVGADGIKRFRSECM